MGTPGCLLSEPGSGRVGRLEGGGGGLGWPCLGPGIIIIEKTFFSIRSLQCDSPRNYLATLGVS